MDPVRVLEYIALGAVLGIVGQLIRVVVGLKKEIDQAGQTGSADQKWAWFDARQLTLSLLLSVAVGGIAGTLAAVNVLGNQLSKDTLITFVTAGYAGTDFLEGLVRRGP